MLAKRAMNTEIGDDTVQGRRAVKRTPGIVFDFSPSMIRVLKTSGVILLMLIFLCILHGITTKIGYDVVNAQHQVVQLKKDNDALAVEVATLKSPTRIQKIATDQLGLVLPNSFVYSTKEAKGDRSTR